jgi:hypothetical protein
MGSSTPTSCTLLYCPPSEPLHSDGSRVHHRASAALYSYRLVMSPRPDAVAAYNAAVSAWQQPNGGYLGDFAGLAFTAAVSVGAPTFNVSLPTLTGPPSAVNVAPALAPDDELATYPTALVYTSPGVAALPLPGWTTESRFANVTIARQGSGGATSFTMVAPLAFIFDAPQDCSGVVVGNSCSCPGGTVQGSKCRYWAVLRRVCVGVVTSGGSGVAPAVSLDTGAACDVVPLLPVSSGTPKTRLSIPPSDACVPSMLRNGAPFGFDIYQSQPVLADTNVSVTVRSGYDPLIAAISATAGQLDGSGQVYFGVPISYLVGLSSGLFGGFGACAAVAGVLLLFAVWPRLDRLVDRLYRSGNRAVKGLGGCCGSAIICMRAMGK